MLANSAREDHHPSTADALQAPHGSGWLLKEKGLVGSSWRRWANLSETGHLDFRDGPESAATDDAIEMIDTVRVVHAKSVATPARGLLPGTAGLRMLTGGVGAVTELTGSVVSGAARGAKGGRNFSANGPATQEADLRSLATQQRVEFL